MDKLRAAAEAALQLCDWINESPHQRGSINGLAAQVGRELRAALAEPTGKQDLHVAEPVVWMHNVLRDNFLRHRPTDIDRHPDRWTPLYAHPPRREWQSLTDEEREQFVQWMHPDVLARVEQALRGKNGGGE